MRDPDFDAGARRDRPQHHAFGLVGRHAPRVHQRRPQALLHEGTGRHRRMHLHRRRAGRRAAEERLQRAAQRRVVRIADPRRRSEILRMHHLVRGQRMALGQHAHHRHRRQPDRRQVGMVGRPHRDADIGLPRQEIGRQFVERDAAVVDPRRAVAIAKAPQRHRHQPLAIAGAGHDPEHAGARLPEAGREIVDALDAAIDLLDLGIQAPRLGGGRQPAPDPLEQAVAQARLRQRQHPAHRRLRHMQHAPRAADRAGHHDGAEHLDLAQVQRPAGAGPDLVGVGLLIHVGSP